jgi:hypothetical protein
VVSTHPCCYAYSRFTSASLASCHLPVKSPWLNPIVPKWEHGKRAIVEPARPLSAHELADRVCTYMGCSHEPHLTNPDQAT